MPRNWTWRRRDDSSNSYSVNLLDTWCDSCLFNKIDFRSSDCANVAGSLNGGYIWDITKMTTGFFMNYRKAHYTSDGESEMEQVFHNHCTNRCWGSVGDLALTLKQKANMYYCIIYGIVLIVSMLFGIWYRHYNKRFAAAVSLETPSPYTSKIELIYFHHSILKYGPRWFHLKRAMFSCPQPFNWIEKQDKKKNIAN